MYICYQKLVSLDNEQLTSVEFKPRTSGACNVDVKIEKLRKKYLPATYVSNADTLNSWNVDADTANPVDTLVTPILTSVTCL